MLGRDDHEVATLGRRDEALACFRRSLDIRRQFAGADNSMTVKAQANLAVFLAEGGGLEVWDKEAPLDWDFAHYNNDTPAVRRFLAESGAHRIVVPHRQNRAVLFNSDLFHETGRLAFREGYENRRINVTMLFGRRGD